MKNLRITVNGTSYDVQVEEIGEGTPATATAAPVAAPVAAAAQAPKAAPAPKATPAGSGEPLKSPMPGTIVSVNVSVGQKVKKGDTLVILEAMKMENEIVSPNDATVTGINVSKGESVESGTVILTLA